jgi:hypothetical protein
VHRAAHRLCIDALMYRAAYVLAMCSGAYALSQAAEALKPLMCGPLMCRAALCTEPPYVLSPSLYGRLCTETAYVQSPLMCGLGAYVFDALMYRAALVLDPLCFLFGQARRTNPYPRGHRILRKASATSPNALRR